MVRFFRSRCLALVLSGASALSSAPLAAAPGTGASATTKAEAAERYGRGIEALAIAFTSFRPPARTARGIGPGGLDVGGRF